MRVFRMRLSFLNGVASLFLLALPASAAPILSVTPTSIALSPTLTVISFDVDPNGTPIAGLQINLSSLATGLEITAIQSPDVDILVSGPTLVGSDYLAGFLGGFLVDRSTPFTVGTVTVQGLTVGTPLVLSGSFTDSGFNDINFGPSNAATVIPEPATAALLGLGIAGLIAVRRSRD